MKTAISLPDDLFETADEFARQTGRSRSELYAEALREYLARHLDEKVTHQLDALCEELDTTLPEDLREHAKHRLEKEDW